MYTNIAVALDGSHYAEQALPFAVKLAVQTKAMLALVQIVQTPLDSDDKYNRKLINQAHNYLLGIKGQLLTSMPANGLTDSQIETVAIAGNPIQVLSDLGLYGNYSLLVMTTHGRTGLLRLVTGSVAWGVIRDAKFPVILIRPEQERPYMQPGFELLDKTLLQPSEVRVGLALDGRPASETAIFPAISLAKQLGARLYLLEAIATVDVGLGFDDVGYDVSPIVKARREQAYPYLNKVQDVVIKHGVECVKLVLEGNPDPAITNWAKAANLNILVMATEAPGDIETFLFGSTVDDVIRHSHLPVMVVRTASRDSHTYSSSLDVETQAI